MIPAIEKLRLAARAACLAWLLLPPAPGLAGPDPLPPSEPAPDINLLPPGIPALKPGQPAQAVEKWLRAHIAPLNLSYEPLEWSDPVYIPGGGYFNWAIRHVYGYEHPEYGPMINDDIFYFDPEGEVAGRTNTFTQWANQAHPVPYWGRGWEKWGPMGLQQIQDEINRYQDARDGEW
jgi:hypothetical protein